jgi:folate-dependent phosphoribosylglycinamide formyltransferase PurN
VRSREKIGWQAEAPAPQKGKSLRTNVGQALSPVNPVISAFFSRILRERFLSPYQANIGNNHP